MAAADDPKPVLEGRSLLLVEDFCRATGLDVATVQALLKAERLSGVLDRHGAAFGLFDDTLPTGEQLRTMA